MQDKTVVVLGAGFSTLANIPIQNKILDEMTGDIGNFMDLDCEEQELETDQFLDSYIRVALYLLKIYGNQNVDKYNKRFLYTLNLKEHIAYLQNLKDKIDLDDTYEEKFNQFLDVNIPKQESYREQKILIKNELKQQLTDNKLNVALEDIFTTFDKTTKDKKHSKNYTYFEEELTKQSILRLFVYYFGKKLKNHSFNTSDYLSFIKYIQSQGENVSIITTNWDTLVEGYFDNKDIKYDLCLNNEYFKHDSNSTQRSIKKNIKLIKLHGSINWFTCLKCGKISIINKENCGEYLFQSDKKEHCICCKYTNDNDFPLLQPEIITPTMIKNYENQIYKNLWSAAINELNNAKKVLFIGYSMPIADFELKFLLQHNIPTEAEIDVILHHFDDPSKLTQKMKFLEHLLPEKRYKDIFINNTPYFYYKGFGKYFDS